MDQQHYVGLDVSLETTSICVIDQDSAVVWRGKCSTEPDAICRTVRARAPALVRVGLETGQMSNWLTLGLRRKGLPVVCLDARHAKAALSLQVNKTDANDAYGLAQVVRTGWFREIAIKSMDAQTLRLLLTARAQLVSQRQAIANNIRGLLKTFGHVIRRGSKGPFAIRVREAIEGNAALSAIVEPLLMAWQALRDQAAVYDREITMKAKSDAAARRLMSVPGVGVVVALAYKAVIDDPARFKRSTSVGAYIGLTPRRYQSGEVDRAGHISKCGDSLLRSYLFEAANVLLTRHPKPCTLKTWGLALAARIGVRRAKVAVARKLAVIMHRVWGDDRNFDWGEAPAAP
ncbi:MAG: IS110 family transposase [Acetobacteraceae bacterium]|nr:IS110 family transposase [Acetobacteraceae bacterium]